MIRVLDTLRELVVLEGPVPRPVLALDDVGRHPGDARGPTVRLRLRPLLHAARRRSSPRDGRVDEEGGSSTALEPKMVAEFSVCCIDLTSGVRFTVIGFPIAPLRACLRGQRMALKIRLLI